MTIENQEENIVAPPGGNGAENPVIVGKQEPVTEQSPTEALLNKAQIYPKFDVFRTIINEKGNAVSVSDGKTHRVKYLREKTQKVMDHKKKVMVDGIQYLFQENGKRYVKEVPAFNDKGEISSFIRSIAKFKVGDELEITGINKNANLWIEVRKA